MRKVMVFGTFDILHKGHLNFFQQAKKHGDYLIVSIARDDTIRQVKGRKPHHSEKTRLKQIKKLGIVDKSILGMKRDKYKNIEKYKPDIICLGYDQVSFVDKLKQELKKRKLKTKVIRLKPYKTHKYKSSKLRRKHGKK